MNKERDVVKSTRPLDFSWETRDPFLFCVYHSDAYPRGNNEFGPGTSLEGRNMGNDFVVKDGWRMYHGTKVPGFPVHPHRGFETVTVVRKGIVDHSDSMGGAGRYGHGDIQWMTAGKGIQHAEMFPLLNGEGENPLELFQIWLNLPRARKMVDPHYTMLWHEQVPVHTHKDASGREAKIEIVAGAISNTKAPDPAPDSWASDPKNEVAIMYLEMEPGARWELPMASEGINRTLYFFGGDSMLINGRSFFSHCALETEAHLPSTIENGTSPGRFLLLQGRPIAEPVVTYGPFVMNTRAEIQQTYAEYQETRFGGWPWPGHEQVHGGSEKGRFARFADGSEEYPLQAK